MSVKRLRAGFVVIFIIGTILVTLGIYALYYFFSTEQSYYRTLLGGLGSIAFGVVLIRASYPIFIPLKKYFVPAKNCASCGAIVKEDETVCEKCKHPITEENH